MLDNTMLGPGIPCISSQSLVVKVVVRQQIYCSYLRDKKFSLLMSPVTMNLRMYCFQLVSDNEELEKQLKTESTQHNECTQPSEQSDELRHLQAQNSALQKQLSGEFSSNSIL